MSFFEKRLPCVKEGGFAMDKAKSTEKIRALLFVNLFFSCVDVLFDALKGYSVSFGNILCVA